MPRPQFAIRALLVAMLGAGVLFGWVAHNADIVRQRQSLRRVFESENIGEFSGVKGVPPVNVPWIRRMMGDYATPGLGWDEGEKDSALVDRMRQLFPDSINPRQRWSAGLKP